MKKMISQIYYLKKDKIKYLNKKQLLINLFNKYFYVYYVFNIRKPKFILLFILILIILIFD